jgi:hypothetical protein
MLRVDSFGFGERGYCLSTHAIVHTAAIDVSFPVRELPGLNMSVLLTNENNHNVKRQVPVII